MVQRFRTKRWPRSIELRLRGSPPSPVVPAIRCPQWSRSGRWDTPGHAIAGVHGENVAAASTATPTGLRLAHWWLAPIARVTRDAFGDRRDQAAEVTRGSRCSRVGDVQVAGGIHRDALGHSIGLNGRSAVAGVPVDPFRPPCRSWRRWPRPCAPAVPKSAMYTLPESPPPRRWADSVARWCRAARRHSRGCRFRPRVMTRWRETLRTLAFRVSR